MSDAEAYFEMMQDKQTQKGYTSVPKSLKEAKKRNQRKH